MPEVRPRKPHRPPGRCIFCGSFGLTREHMWADWLRNYIPRSMPEHTEGSTILYPTIAETSQRRRTGDPHSRRIKCVCRPCNNEWMSRLQETAKPYLVPMINGNHTILLRRGQRAIAAWAAMMVMVSEYTNEEFIAVLHRDRAWLKDREIPPSRWQIWIGDIQAGGTRYLHTMSWLLMSCKNKKLDRQSSKKSSELSLKVRQPRTRKPRRYASAIISSFMP
jgi:hypothetical protein